MAIQFARCAYVSRSSGGNACRKAAYNERTSITCERTGETFCFAHKGDGAFHEILLPESANPRFGDSSVLWNEAERCERRKDSQVAKEVVLALPDNVQVSFEDRIELARRFAHENFVEKGVAVQIDIHAPDEEEHNWHAHLLIPTRRFAPDGQTLASKKATDLDPVVRGASHLVVEANLWGELWRDTQNIFFAEKGYDLRVDPLGIVPQEHLGPVRMRHHMNRALERAQSLEKVNEDLSHHPGSILETLTRHTSVFNQRDIDVFLAKHVPGGDHGALKEDVLSHLSVLSLYDKETGKKTSFYTTHEVRKEEEKLVRFAEAIHQKSAVSLSPEAVEKGLVGRALNEEQAQAYDHCVNSSSNLCIIQGRAGVGKSYVLHAIREAHEAEGVRVLGLAPTHKVATALKDSGFEETQTCHGFLFAHQKGKESLDSKTLVVVDEAAMMGCALSVELFNVVKKSGAKLILVGDDRQLSSVDRSGAFGILAERFGSVELQNVRRQEIGWQKALSEELSQGNIKNAVDLLDHNNALVWSATKEESLNALLQDWAKSNTNGIHQILAQRNIDVDALNAGAREILKAEGKLGGGEITCTTQRGAATFARGDRVQFTKTDKSQGLENGRFGILTAIDYETKAMTVILDNEEIRTLDPSTYGGLRHGYAATVYKAQGSTLSHVSVLHGKTTNQATNYVALTRQTESLSLYVSQDETPSTRDLVWRMGRPEGKSTSLQFDTERDIERRQEDKSFLTEMKHTVQDLLKAVKDTFHRNPDFYQFEGEARKKHEVTVQGLGHGKNVLHGQDKEPDSANSIMEDIAKDLNHPVFATNPDRKDNSYTEAMTVKNTFEAIREKFGDDSAAQYWKERGKDMMNRYDTDQAREQEAYAKEMEKQRRHEEQLERERAIERMQREQEQEHIREMERQNDGPSR